MAKVKTGKKFTLRIDEKDASNPKTMKVLTKIMEQMQESMVTEQEEIAKELGVSYLCAAYIQYFRTRSRWTREKEQQLIDWDKTGKPLPNVCAGDF